MKQNVQNAKGLRKSSEIRYGKIKEERLDVLHEELVENQSGGTSLIKLGREDIAEVVAKWTGIPL
jgi:ATP-dependent Clp protease ATP-binding subunit ClpB